MLWVVVYVLGSVRFQEATRVLDAINPAPSSRLFFKQTRR